MFKRQTTGSVVCASCGSLVGVNDDKCYTCGRRNPGLWGFAPVLRRFGNDYGFLGLVIYGSCVLYALTLFLTVLRGGNVMAGGVMSLLSPDILTLFAFGAAGSGPVFEYGRWWSVLTAGWLHASALHILFNMLWVRQLGPEASEILGPGRTIIVYVVGGVTGFAASSFAGWTLWWMPIYFLRGAGITVGASAAIFALLGALVCYGRRSGSSLIHGQALNYAIIMGIYGLLPGMGVDNYAHLGGFIGGYVVTLWLDPLKPERVDHLVGATVCIAATALAFVATLWEGLPLLLNIR
jgi:membrane associated rhomboid family serine protease